MLKVENYISQLSTQTERVNFVIQPHQSSSNEFAFAGSLNKPSQSMMGDLMRYNGPWISAGI